MATANRNVEKTFKVEKGLNSNTFEIRCNTLIDCITEGCRTLEVCKSRKHNCKSVATCEKMFAFNSIIHSSHLMRSRVLREKLQNILKRLIMILVYYLVMCVHFGCNQ